MFYFKTDIDHFTLKRVSKHIPQNSGVNWSTALLTPVLAAALFQTVFPRAPTLASVTVPIIQPVRLLTALCPPCVPKRQCAPSLWGSGVTPLAPVRIQSPAAAVHLMDTQEFLWLVKRVCLLVACLFLLCKCLLQVFVHRRSQVLREGTGAASPSPGVNRLPLSSGATIKCIHNHT